MNYSAAILNNSVLIDFSSISQPTIVQRNKIMSQKKTCSTKCVWQKFNYFVYSATLSRVYYLVYWMKTQSLQTV